MPTGRWIPTEGCDCRRCRRARFSLHPILITLALGLVPLVVLYVWLP